MSMESASDGVDRLIDLVTNAAISQAVAVAVELGIADALGDDWKSVDELAGLTHCHPPSLLRLMCALAAFGLVNEGADGKFSLTPLGRLIRSDASHGFRANLLWWGKYRWRVWANLLHSVRTGDSARRHVFGSDGFAQFNDDPEAASIFNSAMTEVSGMIADSVARSCDFDTMRTMVDVGGGQGTLLSGILTAHRGARGILFDLPHVVDGARRELMRADVLDRCEIVTGDFFDSVPAGGDAYLLKAVLHDWNDEKSIAILRNCHAAATKGAKVLVIEQIMPERIVASEYHQRVTVRDLNMLVMLHGRERTLRDFRGLFEAAGLDFVSTTRVALGFSVIETAVG
jgi:hypothetical protein